MNYFDLHCDTLLRCVDSNISLDSNSLHIAFDRTGEIKQYTQLFAVFMQEKYRGLDAKARYRSCRDVFKSLELEKGPHILSIENAGYLIERPEDAAALYDDGVRVASLTWNADNPLASGCEGIGGVTPLGKMAARELEKQGIVLDISHLSDRSSGDIFENTEKAIIATHSNARKICKHKRNLEDWQIAEIVRRGGLIGINFYTLFLRDGGDATLTDLIRHVGYFLEHDCCKVLAMGSDFDGCELPEFLRGIEDVGVIYREVEREFSTSVADDIFYNNAERFFKERGVM